METNFNFCQETLAVLKYISSKIIPTVENPFHHFVYFTIIQEHFLMLQIKPISYSKG